MTVARRPMSLGTVVEVLSRRETFLRERIAERIGAGRERANGYDLRELAAIEVAIACVELEWAHELERQVPSS